MFRVLRFSAQTTLAEVTRAVHRAPARRIALVFPPGVRSRFADTGRMEAIAAACREGDKEATIVGGNELLRACAAACGLRAAVTLDDWREADGRAALPARTPRRPKATSLAQPYLALLPSPASHATHENERAEESGWLDIDPPEYVQELLALHGRALDAPNRGEPIAARRPLRGAPRPSALAYDLDSDDLPRALAEHDEERLTATIRKTSGLDVARLSMGWLAPAGAAASDGETNLR
jgi:hypothetical protein